MRPGPGAPHRTMHVTIAASFQIEYRQYLDPDGNPTGKTLPAIARDLEQLVQMYKLMSFNRRFGHAPRVRAGTGLP